MDTVYPPAARRSRTFVTAFARGLAVIEAFGPDAPRQTLSQVAARAGVDRSVARRLLLTLVELGLAATDGKQFELTPRTLRLANAYLSSAGFDSAVQSYLSELSNKVGENASVTILDFPEVVNIARAEASTHDPRISINMRGRLPAVFTASGRLLMGQFPDDVIRDLLGRTEIRKFTEHTTTDREALFRIIRDARQAEIVIVSEELAKGYIAASVPLRNKAGKIIAGLNISSHTYRMTAQDMRAKMTPILKEYAAAISGVLK
jgi:IclR family pca regulon transcriptional regulator